MKALTPYGLQTNVNVGFHIGQQNRIYVCLGTVFHACAHSHIRHIGSVIFDVFTETRNLQIILVRVNKLLYFFQSRVCAS